MSPSVAALARMYQFPPLPPRPPLLDEEEPALERDPAEQYQSGIMMAARRIKAALCPDPTIKRSLHSYCQQPTRERKPIPGWTDGSDAWRYSVYSFASPSESATKGQLSSEDRPSAYKSFAASPHRSVGVYSTVGDDHGTPTGVCDSSLASQPPSGVQQAARSSTYEELYSKYPLSFSRRSESRTSLCGSSPHPQSFPVLENQLEQNIIKPGAEGKLLVLDVKLRSPSDGSSVTNDGTSLYSW